MKSWDINGFLVMLLPIVIMLVMGAMGIIWIVMAQRTKRQAIAAGFYGEQYSGRLLLFQAGVLMLALGIALAIIGGFKLDPEGALAWAAILLACGGGLVANHLLLKRLRNAKP